MDFDSALRYLESFFNFERNPAQRYDSRRFNLERMRRLLAKLGDPHDSGAEIVHIAGTKGKGSTAHMIESILRRAGRKTALYTSPHLVTPRERIRVEGEMISEEEFAALVEEIKPLAEEMRDDPDHGKLTFFELYTAMAFLYFARKGARVWVVETGLGGRLDATNVVSPLLTVITLIGLDHTQLLGDTLDRIAHEKAGIIKRGIPVVSAPQPPEAMEVIERRCSELGARLIKVEEVCSARVRERSEKGTLFDAQVVGRGYEGLWLPLPGDHQVTNALTAIAVIEALREEGLEASDEAIAEGLAEVRCPGRVQVVRRRPTVVLDVAHNIDSAKALVETIRTLFRYREAVLILGFSADKDVRGIAGELRKLTGRAVLTRADNPRMADPMSLKGMLEGVFEEIHVAGDVLEAYSIALAMSGDEDLVCVTGSFYHVGELMERLGELEG